MRRRNGNYMNEIKEYTEKIFEDIKRVKKLKGYIKSMI